jgi:hypothetical protein
VIDPPRRVLAPAEAAELTRLIVDYTAAAITAAATPPGVDPAPAHAASTAALRQLHDWISQHTHGGHPG